MIDTAAALADLIDHALEQDAVALDTEFVWERTYYPALGLVQLGWDEDEVYLIDTPAIEDLQALGRLLDDSGTVKILHDATQDLQILARATSSIPACIFDTQRAAGFVGQTASASLQDLVKWGVGVHLEKGETRTDWLKRPLSDKQLDYAEDDVRYLPAVYRRLVDEARQRDRAAWVAREMERYDDPVLYEESDPSNAVDRVKARGIGRLNGHQRSVLRAVSAWRERKARHLNRTRRMVLPDDALADVALRRPKSDADLAKMKFTDRQLASYGADLLNAVAEGEAAGPEPFSRRGRPTVDDERRAARLLVAQALVAGICATSDIDPALVATKSELRDLVEGSRDLPVLTGWRQEFIGTHLLRLLDGDLTVRLNGTDGWPQPAP
ncbi:MAG: HRDC domain-containing protein [Bacteroidota bacterium]